MGLKQKGNTVEFKINGHLEPNTQTMLILKAEKLEMIIGFQEYATCTIITILPNRSINHDVEKQL